jgi:L-threonylcarbamoyladenylate synthase
VVLRPGGISTEDIHKIVELGDDDLGISRAPGMLPAHYAPHCEVILLDDYADVSQWARSTEPDKSRVLDASVDSVKFASTMYAQLRACDADGIQQLFVVLPEPKGIGLAIRDRLTKAAHGSKNQSH